MDVVTYALLNKKISEAKPEQVAGAVDAWLEENVAQETGYVLDSTLTMSNAAAPADKVGELKTDLAPIMESIEPSYNNTLYITDRYGNVVMKVDKDGIEAVGFSKENITPLTGKKLVSVGDSLSTSGKWQTWLSTWLGCTFDSEENTQGDGGYPAMSVGGTPIMPEESTSIYIRTLSIDHYDPDIIVIFAGQNDAGYFYLGGNEIRDGILGTINDIPYKKTVTYGNVPSSEWGDYTNQSGTGAENGAPTVYSAAMGMIENIITKCPEATIRCINPMYMWCEVPNSSGYTTEQPPYREPLATMWEEICEKYNIQLVDLWKTSGVSKNNAPSYYNGVGNVHFNDVGYRRVAECVYKTF